MRNRFLFTAFLCFLCSTAVAQGEPDATLNNSITWDAVSGAAGYQVQILDSVNAPVFPVTGVYDNGLNTSFALDVGLTGESPGIYKIKVRAVETGGSNPTDWAQLNINFTGLAKPTNLQVVMDYLYPLLEFYSAREYLNRPSAPQKLAA